MKPHEARERPRVAHDVRPGGAAGPVAVVAVSGGGKVSTYVRGGCSFKKKDEDEVRRAFQPTREPQLAQSHVARASKVNVDEQTFVLFQRTLGCFFFAMTLESI